MANTSWVMSSTFAGFALAEDQAAVSAADTAYFNVQILVGPDSPLRLGARPVSSPGRSGS